MARIFAVWVSTFLGFLFLARWTNQAELQLGFPSLVTGWVLFSILGGLALFNIRKMLSSLPLANASTWLNLHLPGGLLAMGVFLLHTGSAWPLGVYEKFLAILFYMTFLTGILGLFIQRSFPRRLTKSGTEYIFERISMEIVEYQKKAKELLLTCTRETKRDTLALQFLEHLDWYFQQPRFFLNYVVGGKKSEIWVREKCSNIDRVLNPQERTYLQKIFALADAKRNIDLHFALQAVLKFWIMFHLPLASALIAMTLWHILVVHVYFL